LSTGFLGTRDLLHALSDNGRVDVAYRLLFTDTYPSWLYPVKNGATSIWEQWKGWTPEEGYANSAMNSFSHYAKGAVGEWMYENIGGIKMLETGFRRISIRPHIPEQLEWAKVSYNSASGRIRVDWKKDGTAFTMEVDVPEGTTAEVCVPGATEEKLAKLTVSGKPVTKANGLKFLKFENGQAVYEVQPGSYVFQLKDDRNKQ